MKILGWILILPAVWLIAGLIQVIALGVLGIYQRESDYKIISFISLIITLAFAGIVILNNCGGK